MTHRDFPTRTCLIELEFEEDGSILANFRGRQERIEVEEDERIHSSYADLESWLVLSNLASAPFAVVSSDGRIGERLDEALLLEIGTSRIPLRRSVENQSMNMLLTHELSDHGSIPCHYAGIVEPITMAMMHFLVREGARANKWLEMAVERKSLALLARIDVALRYIAELEDNQRVEWAKRILDELIAPAFKSFPKLH